MSVSSPGFSRTDLAGSRLGRWWRGLLAANAAPIFAVLLVIYVVASVLVTEQGHATLFSLDALDSILVRSIALGIVAVGQTLVIIAGSLDLSVAYLISVSATYASFIMQNDPNKMAIGVAAVLAIGVIVGLVNGLVITKLRVNPFIATLGMGFILSGILNASFNDFAGAVPPEFQTLAYGNVGPIRNPFLLLGAVILAAWLLLRFTSFGHHLYAVGGSEEVARLSGIRSHRVIIGAHILCSVTAILAGLFIVARIRAGAPWVGPDSHYDLESIAAVVVGGTALAGGRGGVLGTIAGVMILAVLDTTFNSLEFNEFLQNVARGLIIIGAVAIYAFREHRSKA
jgi:ribose/xylose/arabinose/galactoside ABC-type transport system permease subunit